MGTRHGSADGTRMRESTLETSRLILRPWRESDAEALFAAAKNPDIGPRAGWNPHASVEESRKVIQDVLAKPESYAIVLKREAGADRPIGAIGLTPASDSSLAERDDEAEIGYWIDQPYWGHGYMPEAVVELIRHAFEDLGLSAVWCGYYEGNEQSSRVQEKTGFRPHHVIENSPRPLLGDEKTEYANRLTREDWELGQQKDPSDTATRAAQEAEKDDIVEGVRRIARIRSGGQTGADRGGLDAAREAGIPICGWCPAGGQAEDMPDAPGVRSPYPELVETPSAGYMQRTAWNVRDSHATLVVSPDGVEPESGTSATIDFAHAYGRPCFVVEREEDVARASSWLDSLGRGLTLNVAGPRGSKIPGAYSFAKGVVGSLLEQG